MFAVAVVAPAVEDDGGYAGPGDEVEDVLVSGGEVAVAKPHLAEAVVLMRVGPGDPEDEVWREGVHRSDAVALTPVEVVRLDRLRFLNLLHNHPTLAILLIAQQHDRLREQRSSGTCCY